MEQESEGLLGNIDHYWKIIPTHHSASYSVDKEMTDIKSVKVLTVGKHHQNWKLIFDCPNLEEITLDQPTPDQAQAVSEIKSLKRLRIKSFRTKDIGFISTLGNLEEVSLEYVSGFSDLSPLQKLSELKALHLENLRKVSSFDGLRGIKNLKYLHIDGTLDWKQPIESFSFLEDLPKLEILSVMSVTLKASFPAFTSLLRLEKLLEIRIPREILDSREYAFLEVAKPEIIKGFVNETSWPLFANKDYTDQGYVSLLGKGEGRIKRNHPDFNRKLKAYSEKYEEFKQKAREIISSR
ncbi:leucine-rich repeat domain-containing protein [Chryseobacterium pennae]|uniref:Leucine-rich repeat domain-containing protein n=1 Tax=Chryseobacterium pennae TaxID=2258962 RepID=A0A3D9CDF3_9FLAO|nr:leucine-rich repeat domain-containing protein [Chryseobacterium pennae]REC63807.1 leucine-rich repeat domain-containing protein [Chryseobacterium pennae]